MNNPNHKHALSRKFSWRWILALKSQGRKSDCYPFNISLNRWQRKSKPTSQLQETSELPANPVELTHYKEPLSPGSLWGYQEHHFFHYSQADEEGTQDCNSSSTFDEHQSDRNSMISKKQLEEDTKQWLESLAYRNQLARSRLNSKAKNHKESQSWMLPAGAATSLTPPKSAKAYSNISPIKNASPTMTQFPSTYSSGLESTIESQAEAKRPRAVKPLNCSCSFISLRKLLSLQEEANYNRTEGSKKLVSAWSADTLSLISSENEDSSIQLGNNGNHPTSSQSCGFPQDTTSAPLNGVKTA
ncbi:hypothetical protein O181_065974 [Austropuccinia psidii MF-1]|uniref:Uncharacterized protein n=1 Tax=Austropuccinia psidii MF-1 TaxID=1389203 RepID=A0A9Q3ES38_9BASI|nr:hypothetical protein [Austropuccinia psidii MF-1]